MTIDFSHVLSEDYNNTLIDLLSKVRMYQNADKSNNVEKKEPSLMKPINLDLFNENKIPIPKDIDLWEWQVCSEWGFLQTCEIGSNYVYSRLSNSGLSI